MKKFQFVVGIDVSKKTIDVCLMSTADPSRCSYYHIANSLTGYVKLINWLKKNSAVPKEGLFVLEHTGIYSLIVCMFLKEQNLMYSLVPGIVIKKSLGICRGKNDQKDAFSIAKYGYLYREEIKPCQIKDDDLLQLQMLFSQRKRFLKAVKCLNNPVNEMTELGITSLATMAANNQKDVMISLQAAINEIEIKMLNLIGSNVQMKNQYELCTSIPGVGMQLATCILIVTHGFTRFENSRKLASYAGVAPFPYQSGTSIKGKDKTSPMADKTLKSLLHMAALNAVRLDKELKIYYHRKKQENKNPMSVLNAVKNKILARIMATVERGTPYVQLQKYAA